MSHPLFRPHLMQGWSPDFIPRLAEDALAAGLVDRILPIAGDDALAMSRALAREEGIFTGITGGATFAGALAVARDAEPGAQILCMLPDTAERYLSTPLFDDIPIDMSEEEIAISRSTPRFRFDAGAPPPPPPGPQAEPAKLPAPTAKAVDFVERVVTGSGEPVVMFALEWCEFCWSVRKMLAHYGIPYRSVDLDSVEYQEGNWGGDIRNALRERTRMVTIPQIFVGGEFIGGCTETFDAFNEGRLAELLARRRVAFDRSDMRDAYSFLPSWLHPRHKSTA